MEAVNSSIKRCGVCTGFLSGQPFMTSECAHTFHVGCYKHHTSNKNQTCPVCYTRWTSTDNNNNAHPNPKPKPTPNPWSSIDSLVKVSNKAAESIAKAAESIAKAQDSMGGGTNYNALPYPGLCSSYYPNPWYTSYQSVEPEPHLFSASIDSLEKVSNKAAESIAESIAKARESIAKFKSFEDCYEYNFY